MGGGGEGEDRLTDTSGVRGGGMEREGEDGWVPDVKRVMERVELYLLWSPHTDKCTSIQVGILDVIVEIL